MLLTNDQIYGTLDYRIAVGYEINVSNCPVGRLMYMARIKNNTTICNCKYLTY